MRKPTKKTNIILLSLGGLLAACGILFAVLKLLPGKEVPVVSVADWSIGWMSDDIQMIGPAASDSWQNVPYEKDRTILEVFVQEGDKVAKGDPLYQYDATADAIDLELKSSKIESLIYQIEKDKKQYKKYAKKEYESTLPSETENEADHTALAGTGLFRNGIALSPVRLLQPVLLADDDPEPKITALSGQMVYRYLARNTYMKISDDDLHCTLEIVFHGIGTDTLEAGTGNMKTDRVTGKGTANNPYIYPSLIENVGTADQPRYAVKGIPIELLEYYCKEAKEKKDAVTVKIIPDIAITPNTSYVLMTFIYTPEDPGYDIVVPGGGGMTKEQKLQKAQEIAKKIRDAEVELKQLRLDVELLQQRGVDGYVRAEIDGVVSAVNDPADLSNGATMIAIKGSQGFYVRCGVSEMSLPQLATGQTVTGMVLDTGLPCTGVISEISSVPSSSVSYSGGTNNASEYMVTIKIADNVAVQPGQYIEFVPDKGEENRGNALYLYEAYVREIDGVKYVFKATDGKLEQIEVRTGKVLYGYVEILDHALTQEDYVAFPYGSDVKNGAPVRISSSY